MAYIEREAAIKVLREKAVSEYVYPSLFYMGLFAASNELDDIPAADVAPVRHGEWIVCGDGDNVPWMCSHCGKTTANKYKVRYGKYCPNCGAKMDLEG